MLDKRWRGASSISVGTPYRSDIDGLRAVAVLSVLAYHLLPNRFSGGFVGVDIFFVISGFLISTVIYSELESGTFGIIGFYVRRIRRIYPALFLVLVAVCVAGWRLLLPSDFVPLGKQIIGGSTFSANVVLWWQSGYFAPGAFRKPLLHLWSLGVEEQYYLIFPLICLAFYRTRSRRRLGIAFLIVAVASMAINIAYVAKYRNSTFYLPFSRLWELFIGAGLALSLRSDVPKLSEGRPVPFWRHGLGLAGLALIVVSIFLLTDKSQFPGWLALLPTLGAAMVIAAGPSSLANRYVLSCKLAVFIGLISYPLYLWHWPIFSFLQISDSVWGFDLVLPLQIVVTIIASFTLATLTYKIVETPIRRERDPARRNRGALVLLGCVSITGVFGALVVARDGFPSRFPDSIATLDSKYGHYDVSQDWRNETCFLGPEQPPNAFRDSCLDPSDGHTQQPVVLVWGDSRAADLLPGFRAMQAGTGVRLAQYTASLCAPIIGIELPERPYCAEVNDFVLKRIQILKPDVVVLSALWNYPDKDNDPNIRLQKFRHTLDLLKSAGVKKTVVIGPAPEWSVDVPLLLAREIHRNPHEPFPDRLPKSQRTPRYDESDLRTTTENANSIYISLEDILCDQTSCEVSENSTSQNVLCFDKGHFTEYGSQVVARKIWPRIIEPDRQHSAPKPQGLVVHSIRKSKNSPSGETSRAS